jgi:hypothetical protein
MRLLIQEANEMRRFSTNLSIGFALFLASVTSNAQTYGRPYEQGGRYRYGDRSSGYGRNGSPVDRALYDLSRVDRNAYVDHHEREHFRHAQEDLARFQERWSQGRFDRGRLDRAIDNMQHLVQARQLHDRDRDVLASDLEALRYFRAGQGREW